VQCQSLPSLPSTATATGGTWSLRISFFIVTNFSACSVLALASFPGASFPGASSGPAPALKKAAQLRRQCTRNLGEEGGGGGIDHGEHGVGDSLSLPPPFPFPRRDGEGRGHPQGASHPQGQGRDPTCTPLRSSGLAAVASLAARIYGDMSIYGHIRGGHGTPASLAARCPPVCSTHMSAYLTGRHLSAAEAFSAAHAIPPTSSLQYRATSLLHRVTIPFAPAAVTCDPRGATLRNN
jgi:hypothetical protein